MLRISDHNEPHMLDLQRMKNQIIMNQKNKTAMTQREKSTRSINDKTRSETF